MIEVHYEMYHPTQKSPCRGCTQEYKSKSKCAPTCEKINLYQREMTEMLICKICNENEADHPRRGGWCKECVAKDMRTSKKETPKKKPKKKRAQPKRKARLSYQFRIRPDSLSISGNMGMLIMDRVKKVAGQEMRSMNSQILHMLRWCLKDKYGIEINEQSVPERIMQAK